MAQWPYSFWIQVGQFLVFPGLFIVPCALWFVLSRLQRTHPFYSYSTSMATLVLVAKPWTLQINHQPSRLAVMKKAKCVQTHHSLSMADQTTFKDAHPIATRYSIARTKQTVRSTVAHGTSAIATWVSYKQLENKYQSTKKMHRSILNRML